MNDSGHGGGRIVGRLPASRWIDAADLLSEPDPGLTPWLVENLIVDGALVACAGRWKTTKSYAMLHIAVSIATGRPAFGALPIPNPGPVVYCNEESGRAALWRRLDALTRAYGVDSEDLRGQLILAANAGSSSTIADGRTSSRRSGVSYVRARSSSTRSPE
jgi:RecA-family ATPase